MQPFGNPKFWNGGGFGDLEGLVQCQSLYVPRGQSPQRVQSPKEAQGIGSATKPLHAYRSESSAEPIHKRSEEAQGSCM